MSINENIATSQPRASSDKSIILTYLAAIILFITLQFLTIDNQSLFVDEVEERRIATLSVREIIYFPDSMPPLYPLLHKYWHVSFPSEVGSRCLSVVASLSLFPILGLLGIVSNERRLCSQAALFLAISPFFIFYSQLSRGYALFNAAVAIEILAMVVLLRSPNFRNAVLFALCCAFGMYVHYYNAPVVVVLFAFAAISQWVTSKRISWGLVIAGTLFVGLTIPAAFLLRQDLSFQKGIREPRAIGLATVAYSYLSFLTGFSIGPSQRELQSIPVREAIVGLLPWVPLLGTSLPLFIAGLSRLVRNQLGRLIGILLFVPLGLIVVISLANGLNFNVRFVSWMILPVCLLITAGSLELIEQRSPWRWCIWGVVAVSAVGLFHRNFVDNYKNEDIRAVAKVLGDQNNADRVVGVCSDYLSDVLRVYLDDAWKIIELPIPGTKSKIVADEQGAREAIQTLRSAMQGEQVWLLYSRPFHGDPQGLLLNQLKKEARQFQRTEFAGAELYRFEFSN